MAIVDATGRVTERLDYSSHGVPRHAFPENFNTVDGVNADDLGDYTNAYFDAANAQIGDANYSLHADWSGDGTVDPDDLGDFINAYFTFTGTDGLDDPLEGELSLLHNHAGREQGPDAAGLADNIFGWCGYVYDQSSELYCVRYRHFDPNLGRWLQRDPAGFADSMNLYGYGWGSPVGVVDTYGLATDPFEQHGVNGDSFSVGSSPRTEAGTQMAKNAVKFVTGLAKAIYNGTVGAVTGAYDLAVNAAAVGIQVTIAMATGDVEGAVGAVVQAAKDVKQWHSDTVDHIADLALKVHYAPEYFSEEERSEAWGEITGIVIVTVVTEGVSRFARAAPDGPSAPGKRGCGPEGKAHGARTGATGSPVEGPIRIGKADPELRRPYVRKATRESIEQTARDRGLKATDGRFIDPNTGELIPRGQEVYGHKYGHEHWRLRNEASAKGMSQGEFNDWVNSHPEWFQIESKPSNGSHVHEMPRRTWWEPRFRGGK